MKNIVSVDWLHKNIDDEAVRIIDCRFQLGNPMHGLNLYMTEHIPGALYFDLEKDLSNEVQGNGGRHPLPNIEILVDKLSAAGIDKNTVVVAYDDQASMVASRFWWLLKYLGHDQVFILDGGFSKWKSLGYLTTDDHPVYDRKEFIPTINNELLADMEEVKRNIETNTSVLVDAREHRRYQGIEEPIDRLAGHIPGAVNYFWKECMNETNEWSTIDELKTRFSQVPLDSPIIVYCGSGVSACPNIIAMDELGYKNIKLYIGSWSDWISYEDNPIATADEK